MPLEQKVQKWQPEEQFKPQHIHYGKVMDNTRWIDEPIKADITEGAESIQENKDNSQQQ